MTLWELVQAFYRFQQAPWKALVHLTCLVRRSCTTVVCHGTAAMNMWVFHIDAILDLNCLSITLTTCTWLVRYCKATFFFIKMQHLYVTSFRSCRSLIILEVLKFAAFATKVFLILISTIGINVPLLLCTSKLYVTYSTHSYITGTAGYH